MHNLEPVVFVKHRRAPVVTTYDVAIQLDSDARGRKIQLSDEFGERYRTGQFFDFAVDVNPQNAFTTSFGRVNDPPQLRGLIFGNRAYEHRRTAGRERGNLRHHCGHAVAFCF